MTEEAGVLSFLAKCQFRQTRPEHRSMPEPGQRLQVVQHGCRAVLFLATSHNALPAADSPSLSAVFFYFFFCSLSSRPSSPHVKRWVTARHGLLTEPADPVHPKTSSENRNRGTNAREQSEVWIAVFQAIAAERPHTRPWTPSPWTPFFKTTWPSFVAKTDGGWFKTCWQWLTPFSLDERAPSLPLPLPLDHCRCVHLWWEHAPTAIWTECQRCPLQSHDDHLIDSGVCRALQKASQSIIDS